MSIRNADAAALVLAAVIASGAAAPAAAQFDAATLDDYSGAELFERFCASCHGAGAHGNGPVASTLNVMVPDLTTINARYGEFPATLIRDVIDGRGIDMRAHGTRTMPVWGYEFWVEEGGDVIAQAAVREAIAKLVDYLRSLQRGEPAEDERGTGTRVPN
jgi:mono/diheme cytochrome c family protein